MKWFIWLATIILAIIEKSSTINGCDVENKLLASSLRNKRTERPSLFHHQRPFNRYSGGGYYDNHRPESRYGYQQTKRPHHYANYGYYKNHNYNHIAKLIIYAILVPVGVAFILAWLFAMFPLISGIGQTLSSLLTYYNGTTFPTFNYTYPSYPSYNFGYPSYYGAISRPSSGLTVNIVNSQQEQMKQSADVSNMNNNTVTESITASATAMAMAAGRRFLNYDPTDRPIMKNFIRKNNVFLKPVL